MVPIEKNPNPTCCENNIFNIVDLTISIKVNREQMKGIGLNTTSIVNAAKKHTKGYNVKVDANTIILKNRSIESS